MVDLGAFPGDRHLVQLSTFFLKQAGESDKLQILGRSVCTDLRIRLRNFL